MAGVIDRQERRITADPNAWNAQVTHKLKDVFHGPAFHGAGAFADDRWREEKDGGLRGGQQQGQADRYCHSQPAHQEGTFESGLKVSS